MQCTEVELAEASTNASQKPNCSGYEFYFRNSETIKPQKIDTVQCSGTNKTAVLHTLPA